VFRDVAQQIIDSTVPATEMAGCSARSADAVEVAIRTKPAGQRT